MTSPTHPTNAPPNAVPVECFGILPYREALAHQRRVRDGILEGRETERIIILEHPPTVTWGKRIQPQEIGAGRPGVAWEPVERGGQATYHAPGQLVAYPILDLRRRRCGIRDYLTALQRAVADTLAVHGLRGRCGDGEAGIWIETRKIASFGIHYRRGVTLHGLALNVDVDLAGFHVIRPCGLSPDVMTSMARELERPIGRADVEPVLLAALQRRFQSFGRPCLLDVEL